MGKAQKVKKLQNFSLWLFNIKERKCCFRSDFRPKSRPVRLETNISNNPRFAPRTSYWGIAPKTFKPKDLAEAEGEEFSCGQKCLKFTKKCVGISILFSALCVGFYGIMFDVWQPEKSIFMDIVYFYF